MAEPTKNGPPPAYADTPAAGAPGGSQYPGAPPPPQYQAPPYGAPPPAAQPQYPAQQPMYGVQQPNYGAPITGQTTVVVSQPGYVNALSYGPSPTSLTCPHCNASVTTTTSKECGGMVWMVAGIICLVGLFFPLVWLGCCLIPFCIPSLYNTRHTCPNCQRHLGTYQQGGM